MNKQGMEFVLEAVDCTEEKLTETVIAEIQKYVGKLNYWVEGGIEDDTGNFTIRGKIHGMSTKKEVKAEYTSLKSTIANILKKHYPQMKMEDIYQAYFSHF